MSAPKYGPFAAGAGFALGQDDYIDNLGPMLQGDGVDSTAYSGTALQVRGISGGMQVLVGPGRGIIRGVFYSTDVDVSVTVAASTTSARIDRVVLRSDRNHSGGGQVYPAIITGTPGAGAPAITKNLGGIWDIPLGQVNVGASVTGINPGDVVDERMFRPPSIKVIDTRLAATPLPALDGSTDRVVYDKNPAVAGLLTNNGTKWIPLIPTDSGWQTIGVTNNWIHWSTLLQYRILGNRCYLKGQVAKDVSDSNPDIAVVPAALWPTNWSSSMPLSIPCSVYDSSGVYQYPWQMVLLNELPTDVRLTVRGVGGYSSLGFPNYVFSINTSYLLD